eukprot:jgi/Chrpa1/5763/Chrysochromulina_OHIO_Genome00012436-RA
MHAEAFKASSVNGKMLLQLTDQDMLQTLNIVDLLHRRKLLKEIATLRKATLRLPFQASIADLSHSLTLVRDWTTATSMVVLVFVTQQTCQE